MSRINRKEIVVYGLVGVLLVAAITLLMSIQVQSRTKERLLFDNRYYEAAEEAYKEQVQQVLEAYDCYNSGLTMTRIVSLDGEREYQLHIYHKKLQNMDAAVFQSLCEDVTACKVLLSCGEEYNVSVSYEK